MNNSDIRKVDGGLLLVLRELLRTPQTTEVGDRLGLSQSAVSHALSRLRGLFSDPLFIRRPHGLEPTRRARELGPQVEAWLDLVAVMIEQRAPFDPLKTERRFLMSAQPHLAVVFGVSLIRTLRTAAPRSTLGVKDIGGAEALDAVRRGEHDLAFGRFQDLPPGLSGTLAYEDRYCVVARRDHPRLSGTINAAAYAEIGHIYSGHSGQRGAIEDSIPPPSDVALVAVVPGYMTVLAMVAASDAIATVPRRLAESVAGLLGLQVIEPPFQPWNIPISLVRRSDSADAAIDWLEAEVLCAARGSNA